MSPNRSQSEFRPMRRRVPSTYVPMGRLYHIAQQLADMNVSQEVLVDRCVSLLDSSPNYWCHGFGPQLSPSESPVIPTAPVDRAERSYCEVVSVPTSTHVAQIVGKQGSKIKLLRAKSRTYIQTPVNGEEPVFIITGRREDVLKVKREILSASEHFTAISEERRQKFSQNCDIPGGITLNLTVPSFLIGLVVGRNGQTIRNFQLTTQTSIETPKSDSSGFKISGLEDNVHRVKDQIINHVKAKTQRQFDIEVDSNGDVRLSIV